MWSAECKARSVECKVWRVECGVWKKECGGVWSVECHVKCRVWSED